MSLWIRGYRKRGKKLASLLQWDALASPRVMQQRDGSLAATLALSPPDLDSALDVELVAQASVINTLYRRYSRRWGLQTDVRRWEDRTYPAADWPHWLATAVDAERRAQWETGGHFRNEVHLNVVYKPVQPALQGLQKLLYENLPDDEDPATITLEDFEEELARMQSLLKGADIQAVLLAQADLLTYLHSTVSRRAHRVAMPHPACYLNSYLSDTDIDPGIYPRFGNDEDEKVYLGCLRVHAWTEDTYPGIFDVLTTVPLEYRASIRYIPIDKRDAVSQAEKNAKQWESKQTGNRITGSSTSAVTNRSATDRAEEAQDAWRRIENGEIGYGLLTATVVVWAPTIASLKRKLQLIEGAFNDVSMIVKRETLNTLEAWLGTVPYEMYANPCADPLHSFNMAHIFPATGVSPGQDWNHKLGGPPVLRATGRGKTSVGISLYEGDVGHFAIMGSTGDGKSTLLNFLCLQQTRYAGQRIRVLDKEFAALKVTAAMDGEWYDLGRHPLQPLRNLDQPYETTWAVDWLEALMLQERVEVGPLMKTAIFDALGVMAKEEQWKRTMSRLVELVNHETVRDTLGLYTRRGPYGQITDGDRDGIGENPWICFELRTILATPRLLNAVLPALFHRLEQELTGPPVLYGLHEAWFALDTPYWRDRLQLHLKGLRTRNGAVGMVNQSLGEAVRSPIMPAIMDNIASWIFTPNKQALSPHNREWYAYLQINERQCEVIASGTKKQDYYLVQNSGCSRFQLDLGPKALAVCSTPDPEEVETLQAQIAKYGADFGHVYLTEKGFI